MLQRLPVGLAGRPGAVSRNSHVKSRLPVTGSVVRLWQNAPLSTD
jgi:hypothetical protein